MSIPTPPSEKLPARTPPPKDFAIVKGAVNTRTLAYVSAVAIGVVVSLAVLDQAQEFFAPVLAAFVIGIVLSPMSRLWRKLNFRPALAALMTLVFVLVLLLVVAIFMEPYVSLAIRKAPMIWSEFRSAVEGVQQMLQGLNELSENVAASVDPETTARAGKRASEPMEIPTVTDALFYAPQVLAQLMIFAGTLYFFLLSRSEVYSWVGASLPRLTREDFEFAERQVARYFLTITAINACFGVLVACVMQIVGMPSAPFWGILAFLLNFVLYLGPISLGLTLLVSGLVVFDGPYSVLPAALYMAMNATEGQFVTPSLVGQRMAVSPLIVFLSLVFWLWLWGPIGGIIAIPLMIWTIAIAEAAFGQPISSGIPAYLRPKGMPVRPVE